ncbi:hypothetical protein ACH42_16055 [Endozoicomonas sp. (ex Bugula neritina AB1)]|nr:hypothetical protein ACH42_16055 [Endozoicomonas sp. (ex Bugula neritina AB1)]
MKQVLTIHKALNNNPYILISKSLYIIFSLFALSLSSFADDTDIFTGGNVTGSERPQVMIILDTSGSMDYTINVSSEPYNPSLEYEGDYPSNTTFQIYPQSQSQYPSLTSAEQNSPYCKRQRRKWACHNNFINWKGTPKRKKIDIAKETIESIIKDNPTMDFGLAEFHTSGKVIHAHLKQRTSAQTNSLIHILNQAPAKHGTPLCSTYYEIFRYFSGDRYHLGQPVIDAISDSDNSKYKSPIKTCQNIYVIYMTDGEPSEVDTRSYDHDSHLDSLITPYFSLNPLPDDHPAKNVQNCKQYGSTTHCMPGLAKYLANPPESGVDGNPNTGRQRAFTYTIGFDSDQPLLYDTALAGGGKCFTTINDTTVTSQCTAVTDLSQAFQGAVTDILKRSSTYVSPAVAINSTNRTESLDDAYFALFKPDDTPLWRGNIKKLKLHKTNTAVCTHPIATVIGKGCMPAFEGESPNISDSISTYWSSQAADGGKVEEGGLDSLLTNQSSRTIYTNINTNSGEVITDLTSPLPDGTNQLGLTNGQKNWVLGKKADGSSRGWVLGDIQHSKPVTLNYGATTGHSLSNPDIRLIFGTNHGFLHMIEDRGDTTNPLENWAFFAKETKHNLPTLINNLPNSAHPYGLDGGISVIRIDADNDGSIKSSTPGDRMAIFFGMRRGGTSYYALDVTNPNIAPRLLWRIDNTTTGFEALGQSWAKPIPMLLPAHRDISGENTSTATIKYRYALAIGGGYDGSDDAASGQGIDDNRGSLPRVQSSRGKGIYIVDAGTGSLVKAFVAHGTKTLPPYADIEVSSIQSNVIESTLLQWSIPAPLSVLDSDGDGLHDRIYAADTGGNIFRIDIGRIRTQNNGEEARWSLIQLAQLGIDENLPNTNRAIADKGNDRRFLYQPIIVQTRYSTYGHSFNYDAIAIGSGNRANPAPPRSGLTSAKTVVDRFFVIRDRNIDYKYFNSSCTEDNAPCLTPPSIIKTNDLYNATLNKIQQGSDSEKVVAAQHLATKKGWYINFLRIDSTGSRVATDSVNTPINDNEITMTQGNVFGGVISFTTFSPVGEESAYLCAPGGGTSRAYTVDLHDASAIRVVGTIDINDRVVKKYQGLSGGDSFIPNGAGGVKRLPTGESYDVSLGMRRSGWLKEQ